jgi:hypothetical protein
LSAPTVTRGVSYSRRFVQSDAVSHDLHAEHPRLQQLPVTLFAMANRALFLPQRMPALVETSVGGLTSR